jgi:hypothetical protein
MNKKLLIVNDVNFHYEIIESVILKYNEIFKIEKTTPIDVYLNICKNTSFEEYIINKYPNIKFGNLQTYDYYINCTIYDKDFNYLDKDEKSIKRYISHEITNRLKTNPNVYFLTPLSKNNYIYADILPFSKYKKTTNIPIYVVQGDINRRYVDLIKKILNQSYRHKFIIKFIGKRCLPKELLNYKDTIVFKKNLNFIDYHKEFLDAYCILPLISKNTQFHYYSNKLTSSINYARGYKLKCLIDKDLQEIYNLVDVEIYNDINDIIIGFTKTLEQFYNNTNNYNHTNKQISV